MTVWWRRLARLAGFRVACALLGVVGIAAAAPSLVVLLSPGAHDPNACSLRAADGSYQDRLRPSWQHWFGTDSQGCDEFARVVHGARTSLSIGLGTAALLTVIGTLLGLLAGVRGGVADSIVRRTGDVTLGLPFVVGAILLLSVLANGQRSPLGIVVVLSALGWPTAARVARAGAREVMVAPYIEAARAAGAGTVRITAAHVLPNVLPTVIAYATPSVGLVIGAEATLSYLGVGLHIPSVSWGLMIDRAQAQYHEAPYLLLFPGAFLVASIAGFILLGDALVDSLDVRSPGG